MKKAKIKNAFLDRAKEIGKKYGVKVMDGSEREIRAIGIVGGVRRRDQVPRGTEPRK